MKAWWSSHYSDENQRYLSSVFGERTLPKRDVDIVFLAYPDEMRLITESHDLLVCPFTTPPQNVPDGMEVIHLQGHPMLTQITPTVELTWQLILRLVRPIDGAIESVMYNEWDRFLFGADRMLSRMSLLVVGEGRIGSKVRSIGEAFGMTTSAGAAPLSSGMLSFPDIITIHTPPLDYHVLGRLEFNRLKQGVYIINTAQGNAVDSRWLLDGLETGKVAGAAIDVEAGHIDELIRYARSHNNLIITPHIGGSTKDAWHETQKMAIDMALERLGIGI